MGYQNVGKVWSTSSFAQYLKELERPAWCRAITLHHTGAPSLVDRPKGLLVQHIHNMEDFYTRKKWSAGPHLFIDEDEIFGMSDLQSPGIHAVSFNKLAIGIEVLGNYDLEDPLSGRGLACWQKAASTTALLLNWLDLQASSDTVLFHRDDPLTKKSCPGKKVTKDWVLDLIAKADARTHGSVRPPRPSTGIAWEDWQYTADRWCVPVYEFLIAKGVPKTEVTSHLKSVASEFFYGSELLEGAYYSKSTQRTWAPLQEVLEVAF